MIEVEWNGRRYLSRAPVASDLAIPLQFDGGGPRAFGARAARIEPLASPSFSARVGEGASCNASVIGIAPHGNGTHTESVAHLCENGPDVPSLLAAGWMPAWLATIEARQGEITTDSLRDPLAAAKASGAAAFILRTLPNGADKISRHYADDAANDAPPAWFADTAAGAIAEAGVEHLLADLPSLDRLDDPGLPAHRAFFGLPAQSRDAREAKRAYATVSEFIYAPDEIADGLYLLDLQVPRWRLEAVPSRPLVLPAELASQVY